MTPPPPSPSMAPPGLIHSSPVLPDTCAVLPPPAAAAPAAAAAAAAAAASMSGSAVETPSAIQICRIMRPDDANVAGNVHGGTILKMIEEAGVIISTRHCNSQNGERCVAALARVERTDFLSPMCIGEVAHVSAEITYTSKHSVEVQVNVMSENILTGTKKLTNKATLWYVPLSLKNVDKVLEVPPVVYSRQEQEEEGRRRYEAQKLERMDTRWRNGDIVQPILNPEPNTVSYSQSSLIHLVGPSDCTLHGFVHGGVTMKLMDEVAGIVAARHCKTNIVTASVDAINFHDKIRKGYVITISGRMTFTSNKSMEIEVLVDADPVVDSLQKRYRAASAFFTYVSLSQEGRSLPVPQLMGNLMPALGEALETTRPSTTLPSPGPCVEGSLADRSCFLMNIVCGEGLPHAPRSCLPVPG
ncbi:cytosolic acyl coenzyme A thioester hydrolase isoform X2 [Tamandua tetradactyla]|uniref:cytosolic acyl coenzyme A thioester hydrolase isoform X2 n=1 Tax=Tamandua tetradactyla TaxID=48850 RepID=UPI0040548E68